MMSSILSYLLKPFTIIRSISGENDIGICIGITFNLYIAFHSTNILTMLILPIHEHEYLSIYLYLLKFLPLMSHSFQYIDLSPLCLNLFLDILLFLIVINGIIF